MNYSTFLDWAEDTGWTVQRRTVPLRLPAAVTGRYRIPTAYVEFLEQTALCAGPMGTEWFICAEGYAQDDPDVVRWDECERISIAAARDMLDEKWEQEVVAFWDGVLPFFLSVGSGYEYFGFDLKGVFGPVGCVVQGWEPEFEDAVVFAKDFPDFLNRVMAGDIPIGGVLFDPEEYAFMEMAGRAEQERLQKESESALHSFLYPEELRHRDGDGHHHHHHDHHHGHHHHHPHDPHEKE